VYLNTTGASRQLYKDNRLKSKRKMYATYLLSNTKSCYKYNNIMCIHLCIITFYKWPWLCWEIKSSVSQSRVWWAILNQTIKYPQYIGFVRACGYVRGSVGGGVANTGRHWTRVPRYISLAEWILSMGTYWPSINRYGWEPYVRLWVPLECVSYYSYYLQATYRLE
jgi:hypothetical protein